MASRKPGKAAPSASDEPRIPDQCMRCGERCRRRGDRFFCRGFMQYMHIQEPPPECPRWQRLVRCEICEAREKPGRVPDDGEDAETDFGMMPGRQ